MPPREKTIVENKINAKKRRDESGGEKCPDSQVFVFFFSYDIYGSNEVLLGVGFLPVAPEKVLSHGDNYTQYIQVVTKIMPHSYFIDVFLSGKKVNMQIT